jgi:hypothetical protein
LYRCTTWSKSQWRTLLIIWPTASSVSKYQIVALRSKYEPITPRGSYRVVRRSYRRFHTIRPERNHDRIRGKWGEDPNTNRENGILIRSKKVQHDPRIVSVRYDPMRSMIHTTRYELRMIQYNTMYIRQTPHSTIRTASANSWLNKGLLYGKTRTCQHSSYGTIRYDTKRKNAGWSFTIRKIFFYAPRLYDTIRGSYSISSRHNRIVLQILTSQTDHAPISTWYDLILTYGTGCIQVMYLSLLVASSEHVCILHYHDYQLNEFQCTYLWSVSPKSAFSHINNPATWRKTLKDGKLPKLNLQQECPSETNSNQDRTYCKNHLLRSPKTKKWS